MSDKDYRRTTPVVKSEPGTSGQSTSSAPSTSATPSTSSSSDVVRLASIKPTRDFTLGGKPKREFVPNLSGKKKKKNRKDKNEIQKPAFMKDNESSKSYAQGKNRKFVKKEVIQTKGIFEAGSSAVSNRKPGTSYSIPSIKREPGVPFKTNKTLKDFSKSFATSLEIKDEDEIMKDDRTIDDFMKEFEEADKGLLGDLYNDDNFKPINVLGKPMDSKETDSDDEEEEVSEILKKKDYFLFRLPTIMPCSAISPSSRGHNVFADSATNGASKPSDESTSEPKPTQLGEGYLGKIQILKSGRCRLMVGGVPFDMDPGIKMPSLQQLVSVQLPPEGSDQPGKMIPLGKIPSSIICSPDIEEILKEELK